MTPSCARTLVFAGLVTLSAACGSDTPSTPEPERTTPPTTLTVAFAVDSLVLDRWADTASAPVMVRDQNGNALTGVSLAWESLDPGIVKVSSTGVVESVALGSGKVRVTASRAGSTSLQRELPVRVVAQKNAACKAPTRAPRGSASATLQLGPAQILRSLPAPTHDGSRSLAADYDGDGDADIVRLEYSYPTSKPYAGAVRVFRNDGGTLSDATASVLQGTVVPDHPRDFEIRDFTGDGVPDIYVAQHGFDAQPFPGAPNLFLTRNGAQLVNTFAARFAPASSNAFSHGSASGDVDCDGDADIVELNVSQASPNYLFLNTGGGQFTAAPESAFPIGNGTPGRRWQEAALVDFDSDGDPDLFLGARSGPGWNEDVLLVNDGFGRFRARPPVRLPAPTYVPNHAVNNAKAADFNGDGRDDLLLFEIPQPFSTTSAIRLLLNSGDGTFSDASAAWGLPARCTGEMVEPLYVEDLNRDGWPDVVLPSQCPELGRAGALMNTGASFRSTPFSAIQSWLEHDYATPVDINGDGKLDLFFGERGGNPVLVLGR